MRAGPLRYTVSLQALVAGSPDTTPEGEPDVSWTEQFTTPADIRPLRGQALFTAQQINSKVTVEIDVRWDANTSTITPEWRVVYDSVIYEIISVPPLKPKMGARMTLSCATGTNEG